MDSREGLRRVGSTIGVGVSFFRFLCAERRRLGCRLRAAAVVAAGLALTAFGQQPVIRWTFDGSAATNSGSGGSAYDAVLVGTPSYTNGIAGQALRLDGDDYARVLYTLPSQGTIALWFKPDVFFNYNTIFDNSVNGDQWEMWIYEVPQLRARISGTSGDVNLVDLNTKLNGSNQWYHVAYVWDNVTTKMARLYVNGVERGSDAIDSWVAPGTNFFIGGGNAGNNKGKGVVDDVRIYTNALSAAQIQLIHAEAAAAAPVVRIPFDGAVTNAGSGGVRYDAVLQGEPAPAWTNGWNNKGQALSLYGTNDLVTIPYRLSASGTIALWFYVPGPWFNYNSVFDNSGDANSYECFLDSGAGLFFRPSLGTPSASYPLVAGSNRWYHIVGTWDALSSNVVLYVNGVERSRTVNTTGSAWLTAGSNFFIGGGNAGNLNGMGVVSDLQIFEAPLSSNRVAEIYGEFGSRGGLLAYVPFDGTAVDVARSNAVVISGSPTYVRTRGGYIKGLSCRGEGSSDYAAISNVLGSTVGTISLWYYARGPWYNYQTVMDNPSDANRWESWIYSDGVLTFRVSTVTGGGDVRYDLDNLSSSNSWYHIVYTWNLAEGQTKLYVNGDLRAFSELTQEGWFAPSPTLNLAGGNAGNTKGNGIWDEVRVYDRALTEPEIEALMVIPPAPPLRGSLIRVL